MRLSYMTSAVVFGRCRLDHALSILAKHVSFASNELNAQYTGVALWYLFRRFMIAQPLDTMDDLWASALDVCTGRAPAGRVGTCRARLLYFTY